MKNVKRWVSGTLGGILFGTAVFAGAPLPVKAAPEIVAGGYEIDMERVPKVHFSEHKEWETLYETAWESHKSNIRAISKGLNPELTTDETQSYYVDEAFDDRIFQWDTLFMMLFDKYAQHEFPTLNSMDNFYYHQYDTGGESDGFICRMIYEADGRDFYTDYRNVDAVNPPMFAWAEWEQYQIHGDIDRFLKVIKGKTILERLDSYYQFIKRTRRHKSGPMEGLYVSNGQGSGLDNTPDQDYQGWGQAVKDMSFQQVQAADYIRRIAAEVTQKKEGLTAAERQEYEALEEKYRIEGEELTELIRQKLWSEEKGCFFNADSRTGELKDVVTPMAFWSLAAGAATEEQAERMIEEYALNSNKMFRPNGLSTVCYDYPSFKSTGGYWNGAMWSPASFQWLKGLQRYGYDEIAFEEAVRHINGLADVCTKGAYDRYGAFLHTLWENYSTEYALPGSTEFSDTQPARANFVGWAGALGIGSVIEDIAGVTIKGSENAIEWNIQLTEAFGIDNLCFHGPDGENFVSLSSEKRVSGASGAKISVQADCDFELRVKVGGRSKTIPVKAGAHTYTVEGTDGNESYLGIKTSKLAETSFAADRLKRAESAVVFDGQDEEAGDGLPGQKAMGSGRIFNVNTVGYYRTNENYPALLRESETMQNLGTADAMEYVKTASPSGEEGFMFLVPASNTMQTAKVLVGVKGGTATVEADLMDASEVTEIARLKGGDEETVYAVEIPNCAARDTNMMVTVTMAQDGVGQGEISLKAIALEHGGGKAVKAPEQISAVSKNAGLLIDAKAPEGAGYDAYRIYYKKSEESGWQMKQTAKLPYLVNNLENYKRYDVFVTGLKGGQESSDSEIVSQIPEQTARTDAQRAYSDWLEIKARVLGGNTDFAHVLQRLDFNVAGGVYGTSFTFESSSHTGRYGLRNDGTVVNPIKPQKDLETVLKVTAVCGAKTMKITVPVTVLAVDGENPDNTDTQVQIARAAQPASVNLTEEGSADWKLFDSADLAQIEQKADANGITGLSAITEVTKLNGDPCDTVFSYTDGTKKKEGTFNRGIVFEQEGNGIRFTLPYRARRQQAAIYLGAWSARVKINAAVTKAGKAVKEYTEYFDTGELASEAPALYQAVYLDYLLEDPGAVLEVEISNEALYDERWGNFNLGAVTLNSSFFAEAGAAQHGALILTNPIAGAGEEVTVLAFPEEGYRIKPGSLRYQNKADKSETLVEGETFVMPAADVTVLAEFEKIPAPLAESVTVTAERTVLAPGEQIRVSAKILPEHAGNQAVTWSSSNEAAAKVDAGGVVTAVAEGTADITAAAADKSGVTGSIRITVTKASPLPGPGVPQEEIAQGKVYENGGYFYKVTSLSKKTVEAAGSHNKNRKKISLPDSVTLGGAKYKVTSVGAKAFLGYRKAEQAVVGKHVAKVGASAFSGCGKLKKVNLKSTKLTQIGAKAFYRCKALKSVTVKSSKIRNVGKQAFKGIAKNAVLKAPKGKKAKYQKWFR